MNSKIPLQIIVTKKCNHNCLMCSFERNNFVDNTQDMIFENITKTIDLIDFPNNYELKIDGGEPTLRKDIFNIIKYAKKKGISHITIYTNGMMFSYKIFTKAIILAGLNSTVISLHSHNSKISDSITRYKGGYNKTVSGIKNLIKYNFKDIQISHVINTFNFKDLKKFIQFINEISNKITIGFSFVRPVGNAQINKFIVPKLTDLKKYLIEALDECEKLNIKFYFTNCSVPLCYLGKYITYASEYNSTKTTDFKFLFNDNKLRNKNIFDGKIKNNLCYTCDYNMFCNGVFKEYAEIYGTRELIPIKNKKCNNLYIY